MSAKQIIGISRWNLDRTKSTKKQDINTLPSKYRWKQETTSPFIWQFQKPRMMFQGNYSFLSLTYKYNKKAWMTSKIFEEWVRKLDRRFLLQRCSTHPKISDLWAITINFSSCHPNQYPDYNLVSKASQKVLGLFIARECYDSTHKLTRQERLNLILSCHCLMPYTWLVQHGMKLTRQKSRNVLSMLAFSKNAIKNRLLRQP